MRIALVGTFLMLHTSIQSGRFEIHCKDPSIGTVRAIIFRLQQLSACWKAEPEGYISHMAEQSVFIVTSELMAACLRQELPNYYEVIYR